MQPSLALKLVTIQLGLPKEQIHHQRSLTPTLIQLLEAITLLLMPKENQWESINFSRTRLHCDKQKHWKDKPAQLPFELLSFVFYLAGINLLKGNHDKQKMTSRQSKLFL